MLQDNIKRKRFIYYECKMKNIKTVLALWFCILLTAEWLCIAWTWFQTDGWWYVTDYDVIWTSDGWDATGTPPRLIETVKRTINRVLWILWLIALILCLRWWFQMLIAAGDDAKVKTWTKVLKHAAIWLAVIWLSWILVSFIFRLINRTQRTWD